MIILPWCLNTGIAFCRERWVIHALCSCFFLYFQQGIANVSALLTNLDILLWLWRKNYTIPDCTWTCLKASSWTNSAGSPGETSLRNLNSFLFLAYSQLCSDTKKQGISWVHVGHQSQMTNQTTRPTRQVFLLDLQVCHMYLLQIANKTKLMWLNYLQPPF